MIGLKIRLLTTKFYLFDKATFWWDALFTFIDNLQLKVWYKLEKKRIETYQELRSYQDYQLYGDAEEWEDL